MQKSQIACSMLLACLLCSLGSCLKKDYDNPPDNSKHDPMLPVNMTIKELKDMLNGTTAKIIDSNLTIYGIINADDRSGNFYKQINIEDSTGGITVLIDAGSLYTKYPVGRKVYVKLQGLYYGYYNKLPQIGMAPDNTGSITSIPSAAVDNFIVRASYPNEVPITKFTGLASLKAVNTAMLNRLVQIDSVEIVDADTSKTYAVQPSVASGTSIYIEDCTGNKIIMRTSGYAGFQPLKVPKGKGSITALYTTFGTTPQLVIRDTGDLKFYGTRCSGTGGGTLLSESFNSATSGDIALTGWTNYAETGNIRFKFSNAGSTGNPYARISAFQSNQPSVISWLVTPAIDLAGAAAPKLSFKSADGFDNGAIFKVCISTDYPGSGDPSAAAWTVLPAAMSSGHASGFGPFITSGEVDLSAYAGKTVHIAWRYEGADASGNANDKTTTYEIDDVRVIAD